MAPEARHKATSKVRIAKLPYDVQKAVVRGNVVVVLGKEPMKKKLAGNVYGFSREGELIWKVEAPVDSEGHNLPFVDIWADKTGPVYGRTIRGKLFTIDGKTGKIKPA